MVNKDEKTKPYCVICLFDNKYHKMITNIWVNNKHLTLIKKAIRQINFTENVNRGQNLNENTTMCFIIEEAKATILDFSPGTVRILWVYFTLI